MNQPVDRRLLINILQAAYSGEMGAAYAYRGHWKSVSDVDQRIRIQRIESEEWLHRKKVSQMLRDLDERPQRVREVKMWVIGRTIALLCHLAGWFLPMYFAGRVESRNVLEYEAAALHAGSLGLTDFEAELKTMAAVEREHRVFFAQVIAGHRLLTPMRKIFPWQVEQAAPTDEGPRNPRLLVEGTLQSTVDS